MGLLRHEIIIILDRGRQFFSFVSPLLRNPKRGWILTFIAVILSHKSFVGQWSHFQVLGMPLFFWTREQAFIVNKLSKLYWLEFCFITGNERTIILILRWPKSIGWGLKLCYAFIFLFCVKDGYNLKVIWLNNNNSRWRHGSPWIYRGICLVGLLFVLY